MKVSIVIPTYNRSGYISGAITSILMQDYENLQAIIVDDGSTDATENTVKKFVDNKKVFYTQKINTGQADSQNVGFDLADGDLYCTLDDDDVLCDEKSISRRVEMFEKNDCEWIWSSCYEADVNMGNKKLCRAYAKSYLDEWRRDDIAINSIMWRREIKDKIGGYWFDKNLSSNEDWDFKIRCMIHCKCLCLDWPTMTHRVYGGMRSHIHRQSGELTDNEARMREKLKHLYGGLF